MAGGPVGWRPASASPDVASARLRCFLPCRYLRAAGWDCEVFGPERADRYRAVVFQKAYTAEDLELADRLRRRGARVVFDLCDNHFYNPEDRPALRERAGRLRAMIDRADAVTVSTPALGREVGQPAAVIDDALDEPERPGLAGAWDRARRWLRRRAGAPLRLVWFGGAGLDYPPFGLIDLRPLVPPLNHLHASRPVTLTVISNSRELCARYTAGAAFPVRYREWRAATFQRQFRRHDVCLVPINRNPFTLCKTLNRPALSLLLGVPVVADPIPSYDELAPHMLFGDWVGNLTAYADDPALRRRHVREGQRYLRATYDRARVVRQWSAVLTPLVA